MKLDAHGNVAADRSFMSSLPGIFAAGDIHRAASLLVWAIADGRKAAHHIDRYLMGRSHLPL